MTTDTFPAALLEQVARALRDTYCSPGRPASSWEEQTDYGRHEWLSFATAALSALPAAVQAVARGEAVAVPREPTPEMIEDAADELPTWAGDMPDDEAVIGIYDALLAASPYAAGAARGVRANPHQGDDK